MLPKSALNNPGWLTTVCVRYSKAHTNEVISRDEESLVEDVELALHSVVLTSCSLHFRHRLLSQHVEASISNSAPQTKSWVLEEMLKTEEVLAATKVVKFLYTDYLQPDSPSELVGMLKIAGDHMRTDMAVSCTSEGWGSTQAHHHTTHNTIDSFR